MPFSLNLLDEEQKQKEQELQGPQGAAPAMTSGGQTFGGGSGASPSAQNPKGTATQGSGYVGLDKYLNANKGSQFGGQVMGKVNQNVDSAKQVLGQNTEAFKDATRQGTVKWNDVESDAKKIIDTAGGVSDRMETMQYKPGAPKLQIPGRESDPSAADRYKGYMNAKYQGPESFAGSAYGSQAQGAVQKAAQQSKALQSEGGRFALLDQFYGRPKYSTGEKSLDNLLIQNAPGVAARSQALGNQAKQLSAQGAQAERDLNNLATTNKFQTEATAQNSRDYLKKAQDTFAADLNKRYEDYTKSSDIYNQARLGDISDDELDADTMALLGLNEGDDLMDINLGSYLKENPKAALNQFANQSDYDRYLALTQIAGEDPSLLLDADREKAGSGINMGRVSADSDKLKQDIAARKSALNSEYRGIFDRFHQDWRPNSRQEILAGIEKWKPENQPFGGMVSYQGTPMDQLYKQALADYDAATEGFGSGRKVRKAGG